MWYNRLGTIFPEWRAAGRGAFSIKAALQKRKEMKLERGLWFQKLTAELLRIAIRSKSSERRVIEMSVDDDDLEDLIEWSECYCYLLNPTGFWIPAPRRILRWLAVPGRGRSQE